MAEPQAFVKDGFTGPYLDVMGGKLRILIDGSANGGRESCVSGEYPPGEMVPPHSHVTTDELFVVVAGEVEFWREGAWERVPVGGVGYAQGGVMHGFRNIGQTPLRLVATYIPAGFEQLLVEIDAHTRAGTLDEAALRELDAAYQVEHA